MSVYRGHEIWKSNVSFSFSGKGGRLWGVSGPWASVTPDGSDLRITSLAAAKRWIDQKPIADMLFIGRPVVVPAERFSETLVQLRGFSVWTWLEHAGGFVRCVIEEVGADVLVKGERFVASTYDEGQAAQYGFAEIVPNGRWAAIFTNSDDSLEGLDVWKMACDWVNVGRVL